MIDGVRLSAKAKAQCECSDPQKDACHCKGVGGYSSPPRPGLAGEHGTGTHRQEDPAESFDNGGRNDLGFRESQRELYAQVQQRREKKGNDFYNNQNADHRDYGDPATGRGLNHGNFSFVLKHQRQTLENLSLGSRTGEQSSVPWFVLLQRASAWDLLLLAVSGSSSVEKPRDLLCTASQAKSRLSTANPSTIRIPIPIWAEKLARKVQMRPNARGPQTEPMRAPRLESALAAPIVSS